MGKSGSIVIQVFSFLLAFVFVLVGISKLIGTSATRWSHRFENWGYPRPAAPATGVAEVACGVCILIRKTRPLAAATIMILMACAIATHVAHREFPRVLPPLLLLAAATVVVVLTRRQLASTMNQSG